MLLLVITLRFSVLLGMYLTQRGAMTVRSEATLLPRQPSSMVTIEVGGGRIYTRRRERFR